MLIASKNQIDHSGGYVNNWTTDQYMKFIKEMIGKYPQSQVKICRDHCGPGFNGIHDIGDTYKTIESDIKQTLAALKNAGLKLGILSNTFVSNHSLEKQLEEIGILDFFTVRMYSYEFNFRKPDLRIFKIAADKIGEAVENIMYVGDRIDKDAKPTLKLGMKSVIKTAYTNLGKNIPEGVFKIDRLSELPALIEKINK